jgi:hypothetical protein
MRRNNVIFLAHSKRNYGNAWAKRRHLLSVIPPSKTIQMAVALLCFALPSCNLFTGSLPSLMPDPSQPSWLSRQGAQLSSGITSIRQSVDGAVEATVSAGSGAARRVSGRPVNATDNCPADSVTDGCMIAAKAACNRNAYADGIPLSTSTYQACAGILVTSDKACKTKRKLQTALCW